MASLQNSFIIEQDIALLLYRNENLASVAPLQPLDWHT
jgi:hypothetical protein